MLAPSIVYAPGDRLVTLIERLSLLSPVMPISGRGEALSQPIWAEDVADCVMAALALESGDSRRFELAGPQTLSQREIVELVLLAAVRPRRLVSVPSPIVCRALRVAEALMKSRAPATWDEAELLEVSMTTPNADADVIGLGITPRPMAAVLGT